MKKKILGKKRTIKRIIEKDNEILTTKTKHYSPEERSIDFYINQKEKHTMQIRSCEELSKKIISLNYDIPYYIKDNKDEIIISNKKDLDDFFHSTKINKIFDYKYYTFFTKNEFNEQYNAYQNELSKSINKFFIKII